jgi:hypothetical protein
MVEVCFDRDDEEINSVDRRGCLLCSAAHAGFREGFGVSLEAPADGGGLRRESGRTMLASRASAR